MTDRARFTAIPLVLTDRQIPIGLLAGVLAGLLAVVSAISSTLFIFSGSLLGSAPFGMATTFMSSILFAAISATTRSKSFAIMRPQEVAIANLGVMALSARSTIESHGSYGEIESTVIAHCFPGTAGSSSESG